MSEDNNESLLSALLNELNALSEDEKLILSDTVVDSNKPQKNLLFPNKQEKFSRLFPLNAEQEIDRER